MSFEYASVDTGIWMVLIHDQESYLEYLMSLAWDKYEEKVIVGTQGYCYSVNRLLDLKEPTKYPCWIIESSENVHYINPNGPDGKTVMFLTALYQEPKFD